MKNTLARFSYHVSIFIWHYFHRGIEEDWKKKRFGCWKIFFFNDLNPVSNPGNPLNQSNLRQEYSKYVVISPVAYWNTCFAQLLSSCKTLLTSYAGYP